jgi:hypothetical protein
MHLWQEGSLGDEEEGGMRAELPAIEEEDEGACGDTMNMATDVRCYEGVEEVDDLLEGYGEEEEEEDIRPIVDPFEGLGAPTTLPPVEQATENELPASFEALLSSPVLLVPTPPVFAAEAVAVAPTAITPARPSSNVLFRNRMIEISIGDENFRRSHGRLDISVKSLAPKLETFGLSILNIKAFVGTDDVGEGALRHDLSRAPLILEASGRFSMRLTVECLKPFNASPTLEFSYMHGAERYTHKIPLPITVLRFMEPFPMAAEDVKSRWEAMSLRKDLEMHGIVRASHPIAAAAMASRLSELTNMAAVHEFHDFPGIGSAVAVGTLYTETLGLDGNKVSSGCICAFEPIDSIQQMFNLTVRTSIESVSQCVFEATKLALEAR